MENRCFYLHATAAGTLEKRYWFGIKPTLNKLVVQYRQQNAGEDFEPEILEALRAEAQKGALAGATWRVIVGPEADLPEQKGLTLLVLQPSLAWGGGRSQPGSGAAARVGSQRSLRMGLKRLHLGIHFEMEAFEGQELDPNDGALKAMKEAARQLGLTLDVNPPKRKDAVGE